MITRDHLVGATVTRVDPLQQQIYITSADGEHHFVIEAEAVRRDHTLEAR